MDASQFEQLKKKTNFLGVDETHHYMPQVISSVACRSEKYNEKAVEKMIKECSFRKVAQPIV